MNSKTAYSPEVCPHNMPNIRPNKQTNPQKMNEVSTSENMFEQVWSKNKTICVLLPTSWLSVLLLLYRILYVCVTVLCGMSGVSKTPSTYILVSHVFIWSSSLTNKYILQFSSRLTEIIKPPYVSIMKSWKGVSELETCIYPRTS